MLLIDHCKLRWHLDLASHPLTHGWVLNLYRAGEQHPEMVTDYFPTNHVSCPELRRNITKHAAEERKHVKLYERAIDALNQPVVQLDGQDVYNEVIREHTPISFEIDDRDPEEHRRLALAHFLAHAHHLERRISRSLEYHLEACLRLGRSKPAAVVEQVLHDEYRHVDYTRRALPELLTRSEYERIMPLHARGEAAANLAFSARQVNDFLHRYGDMVDVPGRLIYRFGSWLMERNVPHVHAA